MRLRRREDGQKLAKHILTCKVLQAQAEVLLDEMKLTSQKAVAKANGAFQKVKSELKFGTE